MSDRITITDLRRAVEAHKAALEAAGITFDGRLILSEGSKINGIAYRLNLTDVMDRCQQRGYISEGVNEIGEQLTRIDWDWDHADCPDCHGTKVALCTGHYRPPVGDDFLGMTVRDAYDNLTTRNAVLWDVARHLERK